MPQTQSETPYVVSYNGLWGTLSLIPSVPQLLEHILKLQAGRFELLPRFAKRLVKHGAKARRLLIGPR